MLVEVATLLGDEILPLAIRFAGGKLNGPRGWQDQYVAMVALGSVLDGPSPDHIQRELDPAYPAIVATLGAAQSSRVRGATAWLVAQMVRFAP